jgi:MerR family transcriptional regulator, light-induced transcriptional regulator
MGAVTGGPRLSLSGEGAIDAVGSQGPDAQSSIFAQLRRSHPHLTPYRLRKSTLLALSWAIEDELVVRGGDAVLFGAFQRQPYYRPAQERWRELAKSARATYVYADFPETVLADRPGADQPIQVPLAEDAPMRREWAVVCDSTDVPVVLTASELPGQQGRPERDRVFESIWSLRCPRCCARVCARGRRERGNVRSLAARFAQAHHGADNRFITSR